MSPHCPAALRGAALALGTHGAVGPAGTDTAYFQDAANIFLLTVVDPIAWQDPFYSTVRTSQAATFPGFNHRSLFSGTGAIVTSFAGGSSTINDYTVLLSTSSAGTAVPEPAGLGLLGGGLALLGAMLRRLG